jgi:hypothetical protein
MAVDNKGMKTIKNYTSSVPVERTISSIESVLAAIGANKILKTYEGGIPTGISFEVYGGASDAGYLTIKIPIKIDMVEHQLKEIPQYKRKPKPWLFAQAQRTGWRIMLDWLLVQCAMIQLKQAEALEVFLPYVYSEKTGNTFYKTIQTRHDFN